MIAYFIKRFLQMIPKLLIISFLVFIAMDALPIDPIFRMLPKETLVHMTNAQIEAIREAKGLNDPVLVRYGRWMLDMLQGNFGYSYVTGASVNQMLSQRLPATIELAVLALAFSTVVGLAMGCSASRHKNTIRDYANTTLSLIGISIPSVFFAMIMIMVFGVKLRWLPIGGRTTVGITNIFGRFKYMVMPSFCLAIGYIANLVRITRSSMLDVMGKDYIRTARAKGQTENIIFRDHIFRNGSIPVMSLLVGRIPLLVGGSVIIENMFAYPGMGSLVTQALNDGDVPVAMTAVLITAVLMLFSAFLGDIVIASIDPRIRFGKEAG